VLGDSVQSQHFRFLSAQLADVSAHLRAVLREESDKKEHCFYTLFLTFGGDMPLFFDLCVLYSKE
jgi:hypothetical protein